MGAADIAELVSYCIGAFALGFASSFLLAVFFDFLRKLFPP